MLAQAPMAQGGQRAAGGGPQRYDCGPVLGGDAGFVRAAGPPWTASTARPASRSPSAIWPASATWSSATGARLAPLRGCGHEIGPTAAETLLKPAGA